MIIDSSALIAILRDEADAPIYAAMIENTESCRISAATWFETAIVIDSGRNPIVSRRFDDFMDAAMFDIEPVMSSQMKIARDAYRDFGEGSGHPARLNFGDCFAYALAKTAGESLLFKGDDFTHTDVTPAVAR